MNSGDLVLLYTDGIVEAENPDGDFFGTEHLTRLFAAQGEKTPQEIINKIFKELEAFRKDSSFADDISMVVLKAL